METLVEECSGRCGIQGEVPEGDMVRLRTRIHDETLQKVLGSCRPSGVPSFDACDRPRNAGRTFIRHGLPIPFQRPTGGLHPSTGDPASCDPSAEFVWNARGDVLFTSRLSVQP